MSIKIINADVIDGLRSLPEKSVHCVVTSPPYWGLRDYGIEGQIGLEPSPEEYLGKMVQVFREVWRVLRDDGTVWLNIGDCYASSPTGSFNGGGECFSGRDMSGIATSGIIDKIKATGLKQKDLVGMPWRLAFALQAEGWYLRSDIIWAKPNPMPSSVEDRPTTSKEYIFLLTKKAKYFYDGEAIREPCSDSYISDKRPIGVLRQHVNKNTKYPREGQFKKPDNTSFVNHSGNFTSDGRLIGDGLTRNKRDVWTITTQARPECHFATFPDALVEPCIKAGTSERGCCSMCGAPWKRNVEISGGTIGKSWHPHENDTETGQIAGMSMEGYQRKTIGWQPSCTCNAETIPCVVLDPFGGSGTVAKVARDLNRDSVLIEINPAYVEIARRKLRADEQLFADAVKVEVLV